MNTFYTQVLQSIIDCQKFYWCDSWVPSAVLLGGDQPWLRRVLGMSLAPQVGSSLNEAVRDNTAKHWNGIAARRTTRSDANSHRRYLVTRKSGGGCPSASLGQTRSPTTCLNPCPGPRWGRDLGHGRPLGAPNRPQP